MSMSVNIKTLKTRMHFSRMRAVRCSSRLLGGGSARGVLPGGCLPGHVYPGGCLPRGDLPGGVCLGVGGIGRGGVCPVGGCLPRWVSSQGGVCPSACWDTYPLWTEWQTGVKKLPCRNFVVYGNKFSDSYHDERSHLISDGDIYCNRW